MRLSINTMNKMDELIKTSDIDTLHLAISNIKAELKEEGFPEEDIKKYVHDWIDRFWEQC